MPQPPLSLIEIHETLADAWGKLAGRRGEAERAENLRLTAETALGKLMLVAVVFQSKAEAEEDQDRSNRS